MKRARRMNMLFSIFLIVPLLVGTGWEAQAQEQGPKIVMSVSVMREARILKDGKWVLEQVPVEQAAKDQVLVYRITYKNEGTAAAQQASIVDPVPEGTAYVQDSAFGEGAEVYFSIDGGLSYRQPPITYRVQKPDGTTEERIAPPEMVTHIKWIIDRDIPPGRSGQVGFKAIVK